MNIDDPVYICDGCGIELEESAVNNYPGEIELCDWCATAFSEVVQGLWGVDPEEKSPEELKEVMSYIQKVGGFFPT